MVQQKIRFAFVLLVILNIFSNASGQGSIASIKHKKCKLKGQWDIVKTEVAGSPHEISKNDFDCIIRLRTFHRYVEEVHYESTHWIIKGRWHVRPRKAVLTITKRKYITGSQGDNPEDIEYQLFQLDKDNWVGSGTAKGLAVKVYYQRSKD